MDAATRLVLKMELQSRGVRIAGDSAAPSEAAAPLRSGGAGPAQGLTLLLGGRPVSVPAGIRATERSPYVLYPDGEGGLLRRGDRSLGRVGIVRNGVFHSRVGEEGVAFGRIAQLHGDDCLASTVIQSCAHWDSEAACSFCAIGASLRSGRTLARKTPAQLAEAAAGAASMGMRHVVLTTGCTRGGIEEVRHLAACTRAVKEASGLPVQVQCTPPPDLSLLTELHEAGADTIGLHIESLDPRTLRAVAPAKAAIGWSRYVETWRYSVALFGRWQVTSYVILGLGERLDLTMRRLKRLVDVGVYPHVVPLRPIVGSPLSEAVPPSPETMASVYERTAALLRAAGGSWRAIGAGCGRCTACSALSDWEDAPPDAPPASGGFERAGHAVPRRAEA